MSTNKELALDGVTVYIDENGMEYVYLDDLPAKQEQGEPVGEVESSLRFTGGFHVKLRHTATMPEVGTKIYTTPQQRKPLTIEQIGDFWLDRFGKEGSPIENFARAIEAAHGIK